MNLFIKILELFWLKSHNWINFNINELKALNLNEETEKRKTTINIIYNFDRDRFFKLQDNLFKYYYEGNIDIESHDQSRIVFFKDKNQLPIIHSLEIKKEVAFL